MADALRERTAQLLTDYLEYCAREPGSPARTPSTPEAAVLRYLAAQIRQRHQRFLSAYRGYRGNRVELVARLEQDLLSNPQILSWGHVVALLTFAGTLLERPPPGTYLNRTLGQQQELERETNVGQDCQHLVALLCNRLTGRHRAWLEAHDGWVRRGGTWGVGTGQAARDAPTCPAPGGTARRQPDGTFLSARRGHFV